MEEFLTQAERNEIASDLVKMLKQQVEVVDKPTLQILNNEISTINAMLYSLDNGTYEEDYDIDNEEDMINYIKDRVYDFYSNDLSLWFIQDETLDELFNDSLLSSFPEEEWNYFYDDLELYKEINKLDYSIVQLELNNNDYTYVFVEEKQEKLAQESIEDYLDLKEQIDRL